MSGVKTIATPVHAINARRIEKYYLATLSDPGLAESWTRHYLGGIDIRSGARILDYGCGRGRVTALLRQRGFRVVGLDIQAHRWWKNLSEASFVVTSPASSAIPFGDDTFDIVLNIDSTHYYSENQLRSHATEIQRVLRPGGYWIILQANNEGYGASLTQVGPPGRLHSLDDIRRTCTVAGLLEVDHWYEGLASPVSPLLYLRLRHLLRPWPLYMNDHGSWIERLMPPQKRHRWVLRTQKGIQ